MKPEVLDEPIFRRGYSLFSRRGNTLLGITKYCAIFPYIVIDLIDEEFTNPRYCHTYEEALKEFAE